MPRLPIKEFILEMLEDANTSLSTTDIYERFTAGGYDLTTASIRGRLNSLTYEDRILRVGYGRYAALSSQFFNLIMSGNESAWDSQTFQFERSRFLEYTEPDIAAKFKDLSSDAISRLKEFPALFVYEKGINKAARVGRLIDIRVIKNSIEIVFGFYEAWPAIDPAQFSQLAEVLGLRKNEEYRTHWAVKQRGLFKILESAGIASTDAGLVEDQPEVPPVRPAAIEPIWQNGKLSVLDAPLTSDLNAVSLAAALETLREEILELANEAASADNIDQRPIEYLRRLASKIPVSAPSQVDLFRLGHATEVLNTFASTTDSEWPDFLAARYRQLVLHHDRTVRQFPEWRAFLGNAADVRLSSRQIGDVEQVAQALVPELKTDDAQVFVDQRVADALAKTAVPLVDWEELVEKGAERLAIDLLESINNILKRIAELALAVKAAGISSVQWAVSTAKASGNEFKKEATKSIVKEFGKFGKATGPALGHFLKRLAKVGLYGGGGTIAGQIALPHLGEQFPTIFGWIEPILRFLKLL